MAASGNSVCARLGRLGSLLVRRVRQPLVEAGCSSPCTLAAQPCLQHSPSTRCASCTRKRRGREARAPPLSRHSAGSRVEQLLSSCALQSSSVQKPIKRRLRVQVQVPGSAARFSCQVPVQQATVPQADGGTALHCGVLPFGRLDLVHFSCAATPRCRSCGTAVRLRLDGCARPGDDS